MTAANWLPLIIAIMGIGGTLLASWFGYRNSLRVERARWERDDRNRYNIERIRAYTEFLSTGAVVLAGVQDPPPITMRSEQYPVLIAAAVNVFTESVTRLQGSYFQTRILATPAVGEAAAHLYQLLQEPPSDDRMKRIGAAREAFVDAAQKELGVPLDSPTPAPWKV